MNYGELRQLIIDTCEYNETSFVAHIPDFVRSTEERIYYLLEAPLFKRNVTGTGTANGRYLQMPDDLLAPLSLAVEMSNGEYSFLINKDVNFIREIYPGSSTGVPKYYALFDENTFILGPPPNDSFTFELHYSYQPSSLTSGDDSTTTWLSENARDAMTYGALESAYTYMKGEQDLISEYSKRFQSAAIRLKNLGEARNRKDIYRGGELRREPS